MSKKEQLIQKLTQELRSQPKRASKVLGEKYQYSDAELLKKGRYHLKDYRIWIQGLSDQEKAHVFGNPNNKSLIFFEDNELYDHYHFITHYLVSNDNFENCEKLNTINYTHICNRWRTNIEVIESNEMNFEKNNKSDGFEEIISSLFNFVNLCEPDISLEMNLKYPDLMGHGISEEVLRYIIEKDFLTRIYKYCKKS